MPLEVKEIQGDTVFLCALRPVEEDARRQVSEEVGKKLLQFFEAFSAVLVAESELTLCPRAVCQHLLEQAFERVLVAASRRLQLAAQARQHAGARRAGPPGPWHPARACNGASGDMEENGHGGIRDARHQ